MELYTDLLSALGLAWWVEITTESPRCTYYFGPFAASQAAETAKAGYIEDLQGEAAQEIRAAVKRCKPTKLTIFDDHHQSVMSQVSGRLSRQF